MIFSSSAGWTWIPTQNCDLLDCPGKIFDSVLSTNYQ